MRQRETEVRRGARGTDAGFTLIECMLAFFLIAIGLLSAAPMLVYGRGAAASSADLGTLSAAAAKKLEQFREVPFWTLTAGGDLNNDITGFSDTTSDPAYSLRWKIQDDPGATPAKKKTIYISAISKRKAGGMGRIDSTHPTTRTVQFVTRRAA